MNFIIKTSVVVVISLLTTLAAFGQKPKVLSGDPTSLKSITSWDVDVVVDNPEIHKIGDMKKFMDERVKKYNKDVVEEDNAGDKWKEQWLGNFDNRYNRKFCALLTKYKKKIGANVSFKHKDENAKGKVIITVEWIYLGYINPFATQPSKVTSVISFQDKSGKELLKVRMVESPGMPGPYTAQQQNQNAFFGDDAVGEMTRITESFAKCGKDLAGWLGKKAYK